jgi:hypothetical protein
MGKIWRNNGMKWDIMGKYGKIRENMGNIWKNMGKICTLW